MQPLLSIEQVSKSFGGIKALSSVTLSVEQGECVALVGENGAGKSTLMKILSGVWPHGTYGGEVRFNGQILTLENSLDGRKSGISIIHQELCLFPQLTVAENLFLTDAFPYDGTPSQSFLQRVRWEELFAKADQLFAELGFAVSGRSLIEDLSVAERQLVEIARAFHHNAKLLILDEPTSALSHKEVQQLFDVVRKMRSRSMSFIYISHKLDEVFTLSDRIVVLRDGQTVASLDPKKTNAQEVIRHMVGRAFTEGKRGVSQAKNTVVMKVEDLSHQLPNGKNLLEGISFELRDREVLGIAGLMGSGRSECLRSILGILPGTRTGKVQYQDKEVVWTNTEEAMEAGVAFVPEDRKKDGLFLDLSIEFNLTIANLKQFSDSLGKLNLEKERTLVGGYAKKMGVKFGAFEHPVRTLSGGNQQKVLLAKMVARSPRVLLLDEPTRGIDVGAKEEIYSIIRRLVEEGISVVVVSSELPEILALSDRVVVLREGKKMGELVNEGLTQERIMAIAAGESYAVHH